VKYTVAIVRKKGQNCEIKSVSYFFKKFNYHGSQENMLFVATVKKYFHDL